jgi:hypothetical protein
MKLSFIAALALGSLAATLHASDTDTGTALVPNSHGGYDVTHPDVRKDKNEGDLGTALVTNNHGGYNVTNPGAARKGKITLPFFGEHGYASKVISESKGKPNFVLIPTVEDVGHGAKVVVFKKVYFATPEEAEAAKVSMKY